MSLENQSCIISHTDYIRYVILSNLPWQHYFFIAFAPIFPDLYLVGVYVFSQEIKDIQVIMLIFDFKILLKGTVGI